MQSIFSGGENMERLKFIEYSDFVYEVTIMLDKIKNYSSFNDISIVAKYEDARQIIGELLHYDCSICSIELHSPTWDEYDAEYIISIACTDNACEIWCEPMLRKTGYLTDESTVIYILDNCSSEVISKCQGTSVYEVSIGDEDCEEKDSVYQVTVKCNVDTSDADKVIDKLESRMEHLLEMFDEIDHFGKLFKCF